MPGFPFHMVYMYTSIRRGLLLLLVGVTSAWTSTTALLDDRVCRPGDYPCPEADMTEEVEDTVATNSSESEDDAPLTTPLPVMDYMAMLERDSTEQHALGF